MCQTHLDSRQKKHLQNQIHTCKPHCWCSDRSMNWPLQRQLQERLGTSPNQDSWPTCWTCCWTFLVRSSAPPNLSCKPYTWQAPNSTYLHADLAQSQAPSKWQCWQQATQDVHRFIVDYGVLLLVPQQRCWVLSASVASLRGIPTSEASRDTRLGIGTSRVRWSILKRHCSIDI